MVCSGNGDRLGAKGPYGEKGTKEPASVKYVPDKAEISSKKRVCDAIVFGVREGKEDGHAMTTRKKGTKESGDGDDDDGDVEKVIAWIMSKSVIDTFRRARAAAATETKRGRGADKQTPPEPQLKCREKVKATLDPFFLYAAPRVGVRVWRLRLRWKNSDARRRRAV